MPFSIVRLDSWHPADFSENLLVLYEHQVGFSSLVVRRKDNCPFSRPLVLLFRVEFEFSALNFDLSGKNFYLQNVATCFCDSNESI